MSTSNYRLPRATVGFLEQATYSGGRFLFWILAPIVANESWDKIAILSLMNLLSMALYGGVIGGPTFFRLARASRGDALAAYLPCHAVIAGLALIGPAGYAIIWTHDALADPYFLGLLYFLPWLSSAADWSRKTMILLGHHQQQVGRNVAFALLWVFYTGTLHLMLLPRDLNSIAAVFCLLSTVTYLPVRGSLRAFTLERKSAAFAPFSVWRHYLFAGVVAYAFGNAVFWMNSENSSLMEFVILRNYLTPALLLSLYIESYGALELQSSTSRTKLMVRYIAAVAIATALLAAFAIAILSTPTTAGRKVDPVVFGCVVAVTFLIAAMKVPTVYLRLHQRDHLVSLAYLAVLPVWPLIHVLDLLKVLSYGGLEILIAQYVVLLIGLSVLVVRCGRER